MKTDYIIRAARSDDVDQLIALLEILFAIEQDFMADRQKQKTGIIMLLEKPDTACILVAEKAGQVVGMCTGQLMISTAEGGLTALVEDMVIAKEFRRQGIGIQLLSAVEQWAVSNGAKRLELRADMKNDTALEFYKKLKWRKTQLVALHKTRRECPELF